MNRERQRRKWVFLALVILLEWGFLSSAALTYSYGKFQTIGIFIIVGSILLGLVAMVFWSEVLEKRWDPNAIIARRIRLALYVPYVLIIGLVASFTLPLGWKYIATARPAAYAIFRISTIGSIILLVAFGVTLSLWQASLKEVEKSEA
ncbi:hypothetical protein KA005_82900 [bacterium]|nr:hypothetical protein [bacterium]